MSSPKTPGLRQFWIELMPRDDDRRLHGDWYGVSAIDRSDALKIVGDRVFDGELPEIERLVEDVDISTLDVGHVLRNMAPPVRRGIWYPRSFQ